MKKTAIRLFLISLCMAFANLAYAADCSEAVTFMCNAFGKMSQSVNKVKTIDEFQSLDFEKELGSLSDEADNIPDSCMEYKLTKADKLKLNNSFDDFVNSIVDKMYEFVGGGISKNDLRNMMNSELKVYKDAINRAVTLGDFINSVS